MKDNEKDALIADQQMVIGELTAALQDVVAELKAQQVHENGSAVLNGKRMRVWRIARFALHRVMAPVVNEKGARKIEHAKGWYAAWSLRNQVAMDMEASNGKE